MSRRDTIIVAVLINACLLVILFATAITKKETPAYSASNFSEMTPKVPEVSPISVERAIEEESTFALKKPTLERPKLPEVKKEPQLQVAKVSEPKKEAPKVEAKVAKPAPKTTTITVKRGDYLERIARENNTSVDEIMKINQLAGTQLKIGQQLKIPMSDQQVQLEAQRATFKQYTVKSGDTLWHIAKKHNMQVSDLLKINRMTSESANRLQPGDTLLVQ